MIDGAIQQTEVDWSKVEQGELELLPPVLYFEDGPPKELEDSGLYICYEDFVKVSRELRCQPEPLTNLFHTLVLFFAESSELSVEVAELRYNPTNHSYWNPHSPTWKFYLLADMLQPYSELRVRPEFKIPGIGAKGRMILRAVLYDETPESIDHETDINS